MPWDSDFDVKMYTEQDITMEGGNLNAAGEGIEATMTGIIRLPVWGIKQCKFMVNLRDFSLIVHCLGW